MATEVSNVVTFHAVVDADAYQDEWSRLWEEHCGEVYAFYEKAYNDHQLQALNAGNASQNNKNLPVAKYDLSEHLRLLNMSDGYEVVVTVPEDINVLPSDDPLASAYDIGTPHGSSLTNSGYTPAESHSTTDNHSTIRSTSDDSDDSFVSACSDLESSFHDAL